MPSGVRLFTVPSVSRKLRSDFPQTVCGISELISFPSRSRIRRLFLLSDNQPTANELRRGFLSVARGAAATFWTRIKLLDEAADVRIDLPSILRVGGVHKLVAVVVHLHSAERTNHLVVRLSHAAILVSGDQSRDISSRP